MLNRHILNSVISQNSLVLNMSLCLKLYASLFILLQNIPVYIMKRMQKENFYYKWANSYQVILFFANIPLS